MTERIEITGGGAPRPDELAALVVALTPVAGGTEPEAGPSGWEQAAVLEGHGFRPFSSVTELDAYHRSIA